MEVELEAIHLLALGFRRKAVAAQAQQLPHQAQQEARQVRVQCFRVETAAQVGREQDWVEQIFL